MTYTYVDIDSSYRNRHDYPNPADFVVLPPQSYSTTSTSYKNPNSQQLVLYPNMATPALYFTTGPTQHTYVPYMYQTNDPDIVQLEPLTLSPTNVADIDTEVVSDEAEDGVFPLGRADQFYRGKWLEQFETGEVRQILSFRYESGETLVFQTSSVKWASVVNDRFQVLVDTVATLSIPVSNIYNYYRGKNMRFLTGTARGLTRLITDYRINAEGYGVFTLDAYTGILPAQGDVFQLTSTERWFATLSAPFTNLSPYPGYQDPLPLFKLQFDQNAIRTYERMEDVRLTANEVGDVAWLYRRDPLGEVASFNKYVEIVESRDTENYFWETPKRYNVFSEYSDIVYTGHWVYVCLTTDQAQWRVARIDTRTDEIALNVFNETRDMPWAGMDAYTQQLKYSSSFLATVNKQSTTYFIYLYNLSTNATYTHTTTASVVLYDIRSIDDTTCLFWSEYASDTLTYQCTSFRLSETPFTTTSIIYSQTISSTLYSHPRNTLRATTSNGDLLFPILQYQDDTFQCDLRISTTKGQTWYSAYRILADVQILDSRIAIELKRIGDDVFIFSWDTLSTFGYSYTSQITTINNPLFTDKGFTPFFTIADIALLHIRENNGLLYVYYIKNNTFYVLHTQPFTIGRAQQYRIRNYPNVDSQTRIPYPADDLTGISTQVYTRGLYDYTIYLGTYVGLPYYFFRGGLGRVPIWVPINPFPRDPATLNFQNQLVYYSNVFQKWCYGYISQPSYTTNNGGMPAGGGTLYNIPFVYTIRTFPADTPTSQQTLTEHFTEHTINNVVLLDVIAGETEDSNMIGVSQGSALSFLNYRILTLHYFHPILFSLSELNGNYYLRWSYNSNTWASLNITTTFPMLSLSSWDYFEIVWNGSLYLIVGFLHDVDTPVVFYSSVGTSGWSYSLLPSNVLHPLCAVFCDATQRFVLSGVKNTTDPCLSYTAPYTFQLQRYDATWEDMFTLEGVYTYTQLRAFFPLTRTHVDGTTTYETALGLRFEFGLFYLDGQVEVYVDGILTSSQPVVCRVVDTGGGLATAWVTELGFEYVGDVLTVDSTLSATNPLQGYSIFSVRTADGQTWEYELTDYYNAYMVFVSGAYHTSSNTACFVSLAESFAYHSNGVDVASLYTVDGDIAFYRVIWVETLFFLCAIINEQGNIYISTDGREWTNVFSDPNQTFLGITYSPPLQIILVHSTDKVFTSNDGQTWLEGSTLFDNFPFLVWNDFIDRFFGLSQLSGSSLFVFNKFDTRDFLYLLYQRTSPVSIFTSDVGTPDSFYVKFFTDGSQSTFSATLPGGVAPPVFAKLFYAQSVSQLIGFSGDSVYASLGGEVWIEKTLFYGGQPLTSPIADIVFAETTGILYVVYQNDSHVYLLANINSPTTTRIPVPVVLTDNIKVAWSSLLGLVLATPTRLLHYRESEGEWNTMFETTDTYTPRFLSWNPFYALYMGVLERDNRFYLIVSNNAMTGWTFIEMPYSQTRQFFMNQDQIGLAGQQLYLYEWDFRVQTSLLEQLPIQEPSAHLWIYNQASTHLDSYQPYNTILPMFQEEDGTYRLSTPLSFPLPFPVVMEYLAQISDQFEGVNEPFQQTQDKCYNIRIQDLVVPNRVLETYIGSQISFYPYVYVKLRNETTNNYSNTSFSTNNKYATEATFKIAVSQFAKDPSSLPFLRLKSKTTVQAYFNLHKPFRFTLLLPNGEPFQLVAQDNQVLDQPNILLQISSTIRFSPV